MAAKASLLQRLPPNVAIAMFGGSRRNSDALGHSVAIATLCLSVGIAKHLSKRWYSDSFGWDLNKLKKFGEISDIWSKVSEPSVRISPKCISVPCMA